MAVMEWVTAAVGIVVLILVSMTLLPTVADYTIGKQNTGNVTGATSAVLVIVPILYVLLPVFVILAAVGMFGKGKRGF